MGSVDSGESGECLVKEKGNKRMRRKLASACGQRGVTREGAEKSGGSGRLNKFIEKPKRNESQGKETKKT